MFQALTVGHWPVLASHGEPERLLLAMVGCARESGLNSGSLQCWPTMAIPGRHGWQSLADLRCQALATGHLPMLARDGKPWLGDPTFQRKEFFLSYLWVPPILGRLVWAQLAHQLWQQTA